MATKKSKAEEALQLLDDLDSFAPAEADTSTKPSSSSSASGAGAAGSAGAIGTGAGSGGGGAGGAAANEGEAAEVLAFLEEITQKSAEPTRPPTVHISRSATPTLRKSTERVRLGAGMSASSSTSSLHRTLSTEGSRVRIDGSPPQSQQQREQSAPASSGGGWGWGSVSSVWSTASAAIQQAKATVDEQVKHLPKNEQARKWGEGVIEYAKTAQLDKLGQDFKRVGLSTLTDILNVVAPPISEHEVIQVWLSHDMQGYEGIESLSYKALARILEQVEGGDLVLNRGDEARPKDSGTAIRDLNAVEGYDAALKVAEVNIQDVIKRNTESSSLPERNETLATTYSYVYLRIQPYVSNFKAASAPSTTETNTHLQFLIYIHDPAHKLTHTTITQAVPSKWLDLWDKYEWVEDLVAEALRVGVEVVGQEYVVSRMGWDNRDHGKDGSTSVDPGEKEDKAEGS